MRNPRKNSKTENIVFDKSKRFAFVIDDMTDEEYFDFLKNHSIMMKGADDEKKMALVVAVSTVGWNRHNGD